MNWPGFLETVDRTAATVAVREKPLEKKWIPKNVDEHLAGIDIPLAFFSLHDKGPTDCLPV